MELLQLYYFQEVVKYGNMTKAAHALNISQPALSKSIARLEASLNAPLFDRVGRTLQLNAFGHIFLERVHRIFLEIHSIEKQAKELSGEKEMTTSIAISLPHILPFLIGNFLKKYPDVQIKQYSANTAKSLQYLEEGTIDFCVTTSKIEGEYIEWRPLLQEQIYLSVPKNHPFASRSSIQLEEAHTETFINRPIGYDFRTLTDQFCYQAGFTPNTPLEIEEAGAILHLIELGVGISFTPQLSLLRNYQPNTVQIPISSPTCTRSIGIAWNKHQHQSFASRKLRQFTIDFFENKALEYVK